MITRESPGGTGRHHDMQPASPELPATPVLLDEPSGRETSEGATRVHVHRMIVLIIAFSVVGTLLGIRLGASISQGWSPVGAAAQGPKVLASERLGSGADAEGMERAKQVVTAVLAAAPECQPEVRMAGAPADDREEFLREAEELATEAVQQQGLRNVAWRVAESDGRLFGVLYGERCEG